MQRIVVLDQVLKSWLFRFLTTKVDVLFIIQNPNRFLFQLSVERAIACLIWRPYTLLRESAGSNTLQAALGKFFLCVNMLCIATRASQIFGCAGYTTTEVLTD